MVFSPVSKTSLLNFFSKFRYIVVFTQPQFRHKQVFHSRNEIFVRWIICLHSTINKIVVTGNHLYSSNTIQKIQGKIMIEDEMESYLMKCKSKPKQPPTRPTIVLHTLPVESSCSGPSNLKTRNFVFYFPSHTVFSSQKSDQHVPDPF